MLGNVRPFLEYIVACYAAGLIGAFVTAFLALRNERLYLKQIWKTLVAAGIYSLALSKLFQLVLIAFIPRLIVEPPYPLGFLIGMFVSYMTINPTDKKSERIISIVNAIIGKIGLKVEKKNNDDN